ncbi:MAG: DUF3095 domain-containing protein [Anaerolineae bacterium]|nr:DUF3095 domain-containing protein [Anaerolineae bacterium]
MTPTNNERFFELIPAIAHLTEITSTEHYHEVPDDWYVALTDIVNSTTAIENGKYRDVNSIAAAAITALINRVPGIDLPFIFGGDGATILLPPSVIHEAWNSMLATQQMARESFGLELRAGLIPVRDILDAGYTIRVARLKMSNNFSQAIFTGGGTAYAEKLLKDPTKTDKYLIRGAGKYEADFSGFECRWNAVRSPHGETISLLIQAQETGGQSAQIYQQVLEKIEAIYGDRARRNPITAQNLRLRWNPFSFWIEARIKHNDTGIRQLFKLAWSTLKGRIAIAFNIQNWGSYPQMLIEAIDNEKFDDMIRMIISGTEQQRLQLRAYLEEQRQRGSLVYGIHVAHDALVTCIVYDYFGRQVHFVDASDGGYALAAKELKAQLKEAEPQLQPQLQLA